MRHLLAVILCVSVAAPGAAQACSCATLPLDQLVAGLSVVFDGTVEAGPTTVPVISATAMNARVAYRFKVRRVWKGDVGPVFSVAYPRPHGANCGVALRIGETMLIGAYAVREERGEPPRLEANSCTVFNMNQPSLDYARELGPPLREHRP